MQEQFKNIFVTLEVAKMAKEKGFDEICAGYFDMNSFAKFVLPNSNTSHTFILNACDNQDDYIEAPTHFQLMCWIEGKGFRVCKPYTKFLLYDSKFSKLIATFDTINDALLEALKLINHE